MGVAGIKAKKKPRGATNLFNQHTVTVITKRAVFVLLYGKVLPGDQMKG